MPSGMLQFDDGSGTKILMPGPEDTVWAMVLCIEVAPSSAAVNKRNVALLYFICRRMGLYSISNVQHTYRTTPGLSDLSCIVDSWDKSRAAGSPRSL